MADKKLWFCFRGPYETNAWAALWDRAKLLDFFKDHKIVGPVLKKSPDFKKIRVESHRGAADEDGRVYIWGEDEPGSDGPDTQHEGTIVYLDDKIVYNDCKFIDDEDEDHDAAECDLCQHPLA